MENSSTYYDAPENTTTTTTLSANKRLSQGSKHTRSESAPSRVSDMFKKDDDDDLTAIATANTQPPLDKPRLESPRGEPPADAANQPARKWQQQPAPSPPATAAPALPPPPPPVPARALSPMLLDNPKKEAWVNRVSSGSNRLAAAVLKDGALALYRPPSDIAIRAFDVSLPCAEPPADAESTGSTLVPPTANSHKRVASAISMAPPANGAPHTHDAARANGTGLVRYRGCEGGTHPELIWEDAPAAAADAGPVVVGGTVEAICSYVLFGDCTDEFVASVLIVLPLWSGDIAHALDIFAEYATSPQAKSTQKPTVVQRLKLVVETVQNSFSGMLIDTTIFSSLLRLIECLSYLRDDIAQPLKLSVTTKQREMSNLLVYTTSQEPANWTAVEKKYPEDMSDRLEHFLVYFDTPHATNSQHASPQAPFFSPEIFLEIPAATMAAQIFSFDLKFATTWSPLTDISLLYNSPKNSAYRRYSPMVFDMVNHQFLGQQIVDHILMPKLAVKLRVALLSRWIDIGNALKTYGDMVGWLAIATVVCSTPVLRLASVWSHVSQAVRDRVVKEWVPVVFDIERHRTVIEQSKKSYHVLAPQGIGMLCPKERVVPFFGALSIQYDEEVSLKQCETRYNRVKLAFERWKAYLDKVPQNDDIFDGPPEPITTIQRLLYHLLNKHAESPQPTADKVLHLSLAIEPAKLGHYLPFHYSQRSPLNYGSYLPLIFTDVSSAYRLFSKPVLIAASGVLSHGKKGRLNSSSGSGLPSHPSVPRFSASAESNQNGALHRSMSFPPSHRELVATTGYSDLDDSGRQLATKYASSKNFFTKTVRDVLNVGALLYHINDDIVLKAFDDDDPSRPSSVIENVNRLSVGGTKRYSAQLGDKLAEKLAEKLSLDESAKSNTQFEDTKDGSKEALDSSQAIKKQKAVSVVIKAANLERLVDILVLGIYDFSPFVHSEDLLAGNNQRGVKFKTDMDAYTLTFFATFRSFCSPLTLIDALSKRFLGAKSASVSIVMSESLSTSYRENRDRIIARNKMLGIHSDASSESLASGAGPNAFPNWDSVCHEADSIDWGIVAKVHLGVLEAFHLWISQYFSDFNNDLAVKEAFLSLLGTMEGEFHEWSTVIEQKKDSPQLVSELKKYFSAIDEHHRKIKKLFLRKCYKPCEVPPPLPNFPIGTKIDNLPVSNGLSDTVARMERFVDDLNVGVATLFNEIKLLDWVELFELLEVKSADITGFYNYKVPQGTHEDEVVVMDIFNYLNNLLKDGSNQLLVSSFPAPIQELFCLHFNIVDYLVYEITQPGISKEERTARMLCILYAISIIRSRMSHAEIFGREEDKTDQTPTVPSFLESAFIAAILRPESRAFTGSWFAAANELMHSSSLKFGRDGNSSIQQVVMDVESLIPNLPESMFRHENSGVPLVPCIGWIIERMLEIVCYVPNMSIEHSRLINFDKRRYIYNLVTNVQEIKGVDEETVGSIERTHPRFKRIAFLLNPAKGLFKFEKKQIKDVASKELKDYRVNPKHKVFASIVSLELEKIKRDYKQQEILEKMAKDMRKQRMNSASTISTSRFSKLGGSTSGSISGSRKGGGGPDPSVMGDDKGRVRSRFGGLLKAVRPISMAFGGSFTPPSDRIVSVSELPRLVTEKGAKIIYSVPLHTVEIGRISETMIKLTPNNQAGSSSADLIMQAVSEQETEDWLEALVAGKKYSKIMDDRASTSTKVFGVPLAIVCERENRTVPKVFETLLLEVEARGLDELGLYRISGSLASINALKAAFDSGKDVNMQDDLWYDVNTVAGCFKLYLRELPDPLLTRDFLSDFIAAGYAPDDIDEIVEFLKGAVVRLPAYNYYVVKRLIKHLNEVARHDANRMSTINLAIVFAISFLPGGSTNEIETLGPMQSIVQTMINYYDMIFP